MKAIFAQRDTFQKVQKGEEKRQTDLQKMEKKDKEKKEKENVINAQW